MKNELSKCLLCKNPFCATCPANTKIKDSIALIREGKTQEAGKFLFENNPLSAITGAVCPNHLYCHGTCILSKKGNAVDFGKIEKEISSEYLDSIQDIKHDIKSNGKKVLIIGSGPAGLALAFYLRRKGFEVTILERESKTGGMLRYGIPDFRLDKTLIDKVTRILENMGVAIKTNHKVDLEKVTELKKDFDIIVLAIGAGVSRKLNIEGEDLPNVTHALEYLKTPADANNVVIIGGGNVAIDCALTAAYKGAESVTLCYRRALEDMKCYPQELSLAKEKDVQFNFHAVPKRITPDGVLFEYNKEEIFIKSDNVIIAIGQSATENGFIKTDNFRTETEGVYALGDAVTGTQTIIKAVAAAKELAELFR